MVREIGGLRGFFLRRGYDPRRLPKSVIEIKSAEMLDRRLDDKFILVATIQLIDDLKRDGEGE